MRIAAFVIALCLLGGAIDPERGWLIALVVLTGVSALRPRFWNWFDWRPAIDLRLAAFVLAVLLLAGAFDPTRGWLIALSVVTGLAAFSFGGFGIDLFGFNRRCRDRSQDWAASQRAWADERRAWADDHTERAWARWERRMDRRARRAQRWGDDWS
jgi:hypothetical protein